MRKGRKSKQETALDNSNLMQESDKPESASFTDESNKIHLYKDTSLYYIVNTNNETKTYLKIYVYYNRFILDKESADTFLKQHAELLIETLSEYQTELNLSIEKA